MTDEHKLQKQSSDASWARQVRDDERFQRILDGLRSELLGLIEYSEIDDDEGRRNARIALKVVKNLRERFDHMIGTGEAARKALLDMRK